MPVSIKLSAVAVAERGLVERLLGALRLWGVAPDAIVIEVTETSIIADLEGGARILGKLSAEGVEDRQTLPRLGELECDHAQGYAIGRAQPAAQFIAGLMEEAQAVAASSSDSEAACGAAGRRRGTC